MRARIRVCAYIVVAALTVAATGGTIGTAAAVLPTGNTVAQWNKIAEDTVVGSGAFQNESLIYMAYVSAAVYDAAVAIKHGYAPYGPPIPAPRGASVDAAVVEAAYRTLVNFFPTQAGTLDPLHAEALLAIPDGQAKTDGEAVGAQAAADIINVRAGDGRMTPIGTTSPFPTKTPGPGVWRLTPTAYAPPQTPWVGQVRPFILRGADQFRPDAPPSLSSTKWVNAFNAIKRYGAATGSARTPDQTAVALFWTANVIRQYNGLARDVSHARGLNVVKTARLIAMVNVVGADAQISVMNTKYHYLFWRPVTAIDPSSVTSDGFGPVPGYDDGNPLTTEQPGWRPLVTTPNHPEFPAAHGSLTSAMAEVFGEFLGRGPLGLNIHGFDPAGPAGNLDAVRHFDTTRKLRREIVDARFWAGVHYRFSTLAGVRLGEKVAAYDLGRAFTVIR
jgi:hypothetical protein